jgi:EpsI family protein
MKRSTIFTVLLLVATLGVVVATSARGGYRVTDPRLDNLPFEIMGHNGETQDFDKNIYQALAADKNISRVYLSPNGERTWLYIGYYGTAKGGRAKHQPQYCYPGSGWDIVDMGQEPIVHNGKTINVNRIIVQKGPERDVALYWNHTREGSVLNSGWALNWRRFVHRLRGDRDDGAFVRVSAPVAQGEQMAAVLEREKAFASVLFSELSTSWPVEERSAGVGTASLLERFLTSGHSG